MMESNELAIWLLVIAVIFFMTIWAIVGFFLIRWGRRLFKFTKKTALFVNQAGAYPRMSSGLINPRNPKPVSASEIQRIVRQEMDRYR